MSWTDGHDDDAREQQYRENNMQDKLTDVDSKAIQELVSLGENKVRLETISTPDSHTASFLIHKDKIQDLRPYFPKNPDRVRSIIRVNSVASFVGYLNERKTEDTRVFSNTLQSPYTFEAIMDFHTAGGAPSFCTHRCILTLTETDEWKTWMQNNDRAMNQVDFATFIEQNLNDIMKPDGAEMLELALSLEATQGIQFKSKLNLQNGDTGLIADISTDMKAGKDGKITIPKEMVIRISPFRGIPQSDITARFRTVLRGSQMTLGYQMIRPKAVVDKVIEAAHDIITHEAEIPIFSGTFQERL